MGTSNSSSYAGLPQQDHPHAYGDKLLQFVNFLAFLGSSPRVWGQASAKILTQNTRKIIPTRMGTSFILDKFPYLRQGSSPRVWGQDYPINLHLLITRIIPTRMGTSNTGTPWHADDWDHPHAYGDKLLF